MTFTISDPGYPPLRNPHPFPGSETLEPAPLPGRSPTDQLPGVGSNTHPPTASTSLFGWPGDPGRRTGTSARRFGRNAGSGQGNRSRPPFDRLKFWRVEHELAHRLKPYRATDVSLMFRQASWGTILYWSQLLDGIEIEEPVKV